MEKSRNFDDRLRCLPSEEIGWRVFTGITSCFAGYRHLSITVWSKVTSDIFPWNKEHFLVLADYYSDWTEFDLMKNQTAAEIIDLMQKQFARWGIPDEIVTDSGTNYDSAEFSQFCQRKKTKHTKSSPHHHQSNGKAESAVKIVKSLLRKSQTSALNPYEALLSDQRN